MQEGLLELIRLQDVDLELRELEKVRDHYPSEISVREKEIADARSGLEELENTLEELARQQRQVERELEDSKVNLKEHEERFSVVATNKEYDALQMEIEACKSGISERESRILDIIENSERINEQIEGEKEGVEEVCSEQQVRINELQSKLATLQQEVDAVTARREVVSKNIDGRLLQQYDRRRRGNGLSVSGVRKGACGSCFRELPAQQKSDVRRSERLITCESCGAILVWDDNSS